jgi:hypothetical protein
MVLVLTDYSHTMEKEGAAQLGKEIGTRWLLNP